MRGFSRPRRLFRFEFPIGTFLTNIARHELGRLVHISSCDFDGALELNTTLAFLGMKYAVSSKIAAFYSSNCGW